MDRTTLTNYAATGAGFLAGLTANELVAIISIVIALGTFFLNWIYKHKHYRLAQKAANLNPQGKN
ncbi:MAG: hypothetical protein GYB52_06940 [Rhodospirillales bacterium]|nr:hypothetical protein [Rhodospirillales bacterium]MBR9816350.1 hypothetical protein [Rhodospirillales bacterium]